MQTTSTLNFNDELKTGRGNLKYVQEDPKHQILTGLVSWLRRYVRRWTEN